MKVRVFYGSELHRVDYIMIVAGNMYVSYWDTIKGIEICPDNISKIVERCNFNRMRLVDFLDLYDYAGSRRMSEACCGKLTFDEVIKIHKSLRKIAESE